MIENITLKLSGELPLTREELFELVNSWGRNDSIYVSNNIEIKKCKPKECYDLSNLNVSKIDDMSKVFIVSNYNGDLSKWDTSNCINMFGMFYKSNFNNDSISNWNVSNVTNMSDMFEKSIFNGDTNEFH